MSKEDSSLSCGAVGLLTARGVTIARPSAHQVGRNLHCVTDATPASDTIPPLDTMDHRRPFTDTDVSVIGAGGYNPRLFQAFLPPENLKCFRGLLYNLAKAGHNPPVAP